MKKFILSLVIFAGFAAHAQPGNDRQEKVEALYVAYMTRELNLTEEDAEKFWPAHAQFDNEVKALKMESS